MLAAASSVCQLICLLRKIYFDDIKLIVLHSYEKALLCTFVTEK